MPLAAFSGVLRVPGCLRCCARWTRAIDECVCVRRCRSSRTPLTPLRLLECARQLESHQRLQASQDVPELVQTSAEAAGAGLVAAGASRLAPPLVQWPQDTPRALLQYVKREVLAVVPEPDLSAEYLFKEALRRAQSSVQMQHQLKQLRQLRDQHQRYAALGLDASQRDWPPPARQTVREEQHPAVHRVVALRDAVRAEYRELCVRRLSREPVQYICGSWAFHCIELLLQPPVLIPRPETEELVEHVLRSDWAQRARAGESLRVLDIGCGSGAIVLALLASLRNTNVAAVAIDPNETAVWITAENARRLGVALYAERDDAETLHPFLRILRCDIQTFKSDLLTQARAMRDSGEHEFTYDLIVSNPPYVLPGDMATLAPEIRDFEDPAALSGLDDDGMRIIRAILKACAEAPSLLAPGGELWMEVDPSQPPKIASLLAATASAASSVTLELVDVKRDLSGHERFVHIRRPR
jgi:release factor glutamine methyltransferase